MVNNDNLKRSKKENSKKFKVFGILLLIVIILIIAVGIYILCSNNSATGQLESFEGAINNNEYKKISDQLTNNDTNITKKDAQHLTEYLKQPNNKARFNKEIDKIKYNIKHSNDVDKGHISDAKGKSIIEVRKNGKAFLLFDKLKFEPKLYDVYIKGSNTEATYQYTNGHNDKFNSLSEANKVSKIGRFMVGQYNVDAKKIFKSEVLKGETEGRLYINTDNRAENGEIMAKEKFNQAWFKVKLTNADALNENSLKLYINDQEVDYKHGRIYGKYPIDNQIQLYSKGQLNGNDFKTNIKSVTEKDSIKPQSINLEFDKHEIQKQKKQIEQREREAQSFMTKYTEDLNKAYKHHDFKYVSKYFKANTKVAKHIKNMTEGKQKNKYSKPEYLKTSVQNSTVTIELSKKNNKGNKIKSTYVLKYDEDTKQFKIEKYQDI